MGLGIGSIVSVGGTGTGGTGSASGITEINGQTGPIINVVGVNGAVVSVPVSNTILIDVASLSGLIGTGTQSGVIGINGIYVHQIAGQFVVDGASLSGLITPSGGIGSINGQIGPAIDINGVNGVTVTVTAQNQITINAASLSGQIPSPDGSGINAINGDLGPNIDFIGTSGIQITPLGNGIILVGTSGEFLTSQSGVVGVNGITVEQIGGNFVVNAASLSGQIPSPDGSGINAINGDKGPNVDLIGVSGIQVTPLGNGLILIGTSGEFLTSQSGVIGVNGIIVQQINGNFVVDSSSLSGLITPSGGIGGINGQIGPHINIEGVNGITVSVSSTNNILINGAGASGVGGTTPSSGLCYAENFTGIISNTFTHNLGTTNVVVDLFNNSNIQMLPDQVRIIDANNVFVRFNQPQTGKVVIIACGGNNTNLEEARRYALLVS